MERHWVVFSFRLTNSPHWCLVVLLFQKYFGDEFYEEEELEKPQFEDDDDEFDEDGTANLVYSF